MNLNQQEANISLSDKLFVIEKKKQILQAIFKFNQLISNLLSSVEAIGFMTESSFRLPPKIAVFYRALYGRYKHDPVSRIQHNLEEIELITSHDLVAILHLTKLDEAAFQELYCQTKNQKCELDFWEMVDVFKRRMQTAISLRLILKERGISHKPLKLAVSGDEIAQKIVKLEKKEKECIENMKQQMDVLVVDIDKIINVIDVEHDNYANLVLMRKGLADNIYYLSQGKSIDELPYEFEAVVEQDEASEEKSSKNKSSKNKSSEVDTDTCKQSDTVPSNVKVRPKMKERSETVSKLSGATKSDQVRKKKSKAHVQPVHNSTTNNNIAKQDINSQAVTKKSRSLINRQERATSKSALKEPKSITKELTSLEELAPIEQKRLTLFSRVWQWLNSSIRDRSSNRDNDLN